LAYFLLDIHQDPSWILRRVETVTVLSAQRIERRTTLDIDCHDLRGRAVAAGITSLDRLPVALALPPKNLLLDIDVRDSRGAALPAAVSDRDSAAAELLMLARLSNVGVDPSLLNPAIPQKLYDIAARMPSAEDVEALGTGGEGGDIFIDAWRLDHGLTVSRHDVDQWVALFDDDDFASLVITFSLQYMLISMIDTASEDVSIVKLRHVETAGEPPKSSLGERFGLVSFGYLVEAPAVGYAAREHFRFVAPPGMYLEGSILVDLGESPAMGASHIAPAISGTSYDLRTTPERVIVYSKGLLKGTYLALISMRADPVAFVRPALLSVLASLLLLVGGLWAELSTGVLSNGESSVEAAVAILLVFPSALSAYIIREGEHEILRYLLLYPRVAVTVSAAATIAASGAVVIEIPRRALEWTWATFAAINLVTFVLLVAINMLAVRSYKSTQASAARTATEKVARY
jgi:hypothetical protein